MDAYKFLKAGAVGPFSGLTWAPGEWVEASGELGLCRNGVHACTASVLPYWIDDELWRIELDGDSVEADGVVIARRGRLTDRVSSWDADAQRAFANACAERAAASAETSGREDTRSRAEDARSLAGQPISAVNVACCSYIAARAADDASLDGWARERAWQAAWLADRLGLQLP